MKNIEQISCKKCSTVNPLYTSKCINCSAYLRERVVNIDLWKTIGELIEDNKTAFQQILFAENKNFIIFITSFLAIKNLILARFFSVPDLGINGVRVPFILSYIIMLLLTFSFFGVFTIIQNYYYKKLKIGIRFKDVYALNIYSFIPVVLGLFLIFPVELVVLGGDIFSNNPNPFQIKPLIAYLLSGIEIILFIWSTIILVKSIIFISRKIIIPISLSTLFLLSLIFLYFYSAKIIF